MAAPTDNELEQKRSKNEKLRDQLAAAQAKTADALSDQNNVIEGKTLDAETARLEAQLAAAKEQAKVSSIRSGNEGTLAAVDAQLEAARGGITPPGVTVDTNAGVEDKSSSTTTAADAPSASTDGTSTTTAKKTGGNS